ncbi:MAG: alpha/beta hydrolase-fold protein [Thermoguttaceae bacterium]
MPRTQRSVPIGFSAPPKLEPTFQVDSARCTTGCLDFPHALFAPLHYAPGYAYPLVVWLHGPGDDERQLQRIMPMVSMQNYLAAAPRGLTSSGSTDAANEGCRWRQTDHDIQQASQRVFETVEIARQKFHIHPRRVFLAGFDCGGTMALRLAMSHPSRFAGVVSLCGQFPTGNSPLGNLIAARRLGLLLASGRDSQRYPAAAVCDDLRLLHTAGLSVTVRQYPCGDELTPQMLADVNRWIMEQILSPRSALSESDAD